MHVNACLPRCLFLEYNIAANPMLRDIIQNPVLMEEDGMIAVPDRPGLGIDIDAAAIEKYRVG